MSKTALGGGQAHFQSGAIWKQSGKSVKYKSFECDQRLSQKLGARQKYDARAKKNLIFLAINLPPNFFTMPFQYQTKHAEVLKIA